MKAQRNHNSFAALFCLVVSLIFASAAAGQPSLHKALDQDGDHKADFLIFRPGNNTWYARKSDGTQTYTNFGLKDRDVLVPGDYDGDGHGDIAVWRDTDAVWWRINSSNSSVTAVRFGESGDEPVARDYTGDGRTDIAVVRRSGGAMTWYILDTATGAFTGREYGYATDTVAPGDYDGDGKFDLAIQRPASNGSSQAVFWIRPSTSPNGFVGVPWGLNGDIFAPGDYDGDGKTDLTVLRETNGSLVWYIRRSLDFQLAVYQWGLSASDYPVQGDYDNDGKTDVAVWRDTDGTFYIRKSGDGNMQSERWGAAGDIPIASYDSR